MTEKIGLVAGEGQFPQEAVTSIGRRGGQVVTVGFHGLTDAEFDCSKGGGARIYLGQIGTLFEIFKTSGCKEILLTGKVPKKFLFQDLSALRPDAKLFELMGKLGDRKDDSILRTFARALESEGFILVEQCAVCPDLVAKEGILGGIEPTDDQIEDVLFGWPIAKKLGEVDVGQTVVVRGKAVFSLEAIEGTDEAIRRGGSLSGVGSSVIKVAKPNQDPRFDVPVVGLETLEVASSVGVKAIAVEAGATLIVQRERFFSEADRRGISILGVNSQGRCR